MKDQHKMFSRFKQLKQVLLTLIRRPLSWWLWMWQSNQHEQTINWLLFSLERRVKTIITWLSHIALSLLYFDSLTYYSCLHHSQTFPPFGAVLTLFERFNQGGLFLFLKFSVENLKIHFDNWNFNFLWLLFIRSNRSSLEL